MSKLVELKIYIKSLDLVKKIYQLIKNNPNLMKDFSLCDQIKRASVSVPANISEGYMRIKKQFQYHLDVSSGSSNEMVTLLTVVFLVYEIKTIELQEEYIILGKQIISFSNSFH